MLVVLYAELQIEKKGSATTVYPKPELTLYMFLRFFVLVYSVTWSTTIYIEFYSNLHRRFFSYYEHDDYSLGY